MQEFVDSLIATGTLPAGLPSWIPYLAAMLLFGGIVVFVFILPIAGITTWVERRVAGRIQSRIGPNRTGPAGPRLRTSGGTTSPLRGETTPTTSRVPLSLPPSAPPTTR